MKKKSRKQELIELAEARLEELEFELLLPPDRLSDEEFQELITEAVKLREMLEFLK
ncbi:hypothetical protein [Dyadobacter luticola]|uniref:hypothetical protein n=1 Tax=Dyadobacter luticola TaxID=1979387 RepID=UPI00148642D7|nr:hypothetical protein [Dyadobacter luticola]